MHVYKRQQSRGKRNARLCVLAKVHRKVSSTLEMPEIMLITIHIRKLVTLDYATAKYIW